MSKKNSLKDGCRYAKEVEDYKEKVKKEAENLVKVVFPRKVTELNELIKDDRFALDRLSTVDDDINIPVPGPEAKQTTEDGPPAKKARLTDVADNSCMGPKVVLLPHGVSRSNRHISELFDLIKPHVIDLIEHANHIKMWIAYLMPKIEDGNNFGVEIQEETMSEASQIATEATTYLDSISGYYLSRGRLIGRIAKYPHVEDIRRTVVELDKKQFVCLRLLCSELRNHYANLHDLILKNFEKITKPRSNHAESMF